MKLPTLHLLGIPHTVSFDDRYSHCAFTTKVNRFVPMMQSVDYEVIHYGTVNVSIDPKCECAHIFFPPSDLEKRTKFDPESRNFVGNHIGGELYKEFNERLAILLDERVQPGDMICCPFGPAHLPALQSSEAAKKAFWVETGIGYEQTFAKYRVFESSAWMHYHYGKQQALSGNNRGSDYDWVIPNYFDIAEWKPSYSPGKYVLYFGRIGEAKGMDIVREIALRRPDLKFVVCGQGDGTPWLTPNMELRAPVHGKKRNELLQDAIVVLVPSRYVEPFGGVAVEAMLCGRPVLASAFGAFSETLAPQCFSCRTLSEWLRGIKWCEGDSQSDYVQIRKFAEERFNMRHLALQYHRAFKQISQLSGAGWYSLDN